MKMLQIHLLHLLYCTLLLFNCSGCISLNFSQISDITSKAIRSYGIEIVFIFMNPTIADIIDQEGDGAAQLLGSIDVPMLFVPASDAQQYDDIFIMKYSKNSLCLLAIAEDQCMNEKLLLQFDRVMTKNHITKFMVFYGGSEMAAPTEVEWIFRWCWRHNFLNVVLFASVASQGHSQKLYTYSPFPVFAIAEVRTDAQRIDVANGRIFPHKFRNIHGYALNTNIQEDPPRMYQYYDKKQKRLINSGYIKKFYKEFVDYINGSMVIGKYFSETEWQLDSDIRLIQSGHIDFSMDLYPVLRQLFMTNLTYTNPEALSSWSLMIPSSREIDSYRYFTHPFRAQLWTAILLSVVALTLINAFAQRLIDTDASSRDLDLSKSFCQIILYICYLPTMSKKQYSPCFEYMRRSKADAKLRYHAPFRRYSWKLAIISVPYVAFGFIMAMLYQTHLSSFLVTRLYEPDIDTLQGVVKANIMLATFESEYNLILQSGSYSERFLAQFFIMDFQSFEQQRSKLNTSRGGYTVKWDKSKYYLSQVQKQQHPVMRLVREPLSSLHFAFPLHLNCPFVHVLQNFTMTVQQSGLMTKWFDDAIQECYAHGLLNYFPAQQSEQFIPIDVEYLQFAWLILVLGLLVSCGSLLYEFLAQQCIQRSMSKRQLLKQLIYKQ